MKLAAAAVFMAMLGSCTLFRKQKPPTPVIAAPSPKPQAAEPPKPITPPPTVATQPLPNATPPPEVVQTATPAPPPPPPKPVRRDRRPRATTAQTPIPPPPAPQPAAPPQLTTLVSPEEQQRLNTAIDAAIKNAGADLARLASLRLAGQENSNYERAKAFLKQAQDARSTDLQTALALAQRAETLARDLVASIR